MDQEPPAADNRTRRLAWALFGWLGIPILFVTLIAPTVFYLTGLSQGGVVVAAIVTAVGGAFSIAKGQRPRRMWIVILYPLPMIYLLMLAAVIAVRLGSGW